MAAPTAVLPQLLNGRFRTTGKLMGIALAILALSPEMKFRVRSAEEAFGGGVDLQIMFELGLWGAFGGWALLQVVRGLTSGRYSFGRLGPGMNTMLVFWLLACTTGVAALSIRSMVRSFQLTMMVTSLLLLYWEARRHREFFLDAWIWFRRTFVAAVLGSMASSAVLNLLFDVWPTHIDVDGFSRYRFFFVHPISVGGMSGVALVLLLGMLIGKQDLPPKQWQYAAMWGGAAALFGAIVATRSRGSLAGIIVAVAVIVLLSKHRQVKVLSIAGGVAAIIGIIGYAATPSGSEALSRLITRGQTAEQIATLSQRTDLFAIAGDLFVERPIFGYGYFMPGPIFSNFFEWAGHGHNIFVEMAVAMGAAGILVLLAIMIIPAVNVIRSARSNGASPMRSLVPEMAAIYVLLQAMGVIGPGISGSVAYEAFGFLLFAAYADLFRADTKWASLRRAPQRWDRQPVAAQPDELDIEIEKLLKDQPVGRLAPHVEQEPSRDELTPSSFAEKYDPRPPSHDDLQRIKGVGPKVELALHRAGITTFAHLAQKTPKQLNAILRFSGLRFLRISPAEWPDAARMAMLAEEARQEAAGQE
jgi:O-antigen ligase/predicted flap endonuclease-1-like 5' DNA nuclease